MAHFVCQPGCATGIKTFVQVMILGGFGRIFLDEMRLAWPTKASTLTFSVWVGFMQSAEDVSGTTGQAGGNCSRLTALSWDMEYFLPSQCRLQLNTSSFQTLSLPVFRLQGNHQHFSVYTADFWTSPPPCELISHYLSLILLFLVPSSTFYWFYFSGKP